MYQEWINNGRICILSTEALYVTALWKSLVTLVPAIILLGTRAAYDRKAERTALVFMGITHPQQQIKQSNNLFSKIPTG